MNKVVTPTIEVPIPASLQEAVDPSLITNITSLIDPTSITTGIISGIIASIIFLFYSRKKIPKITLSNDVITDHDPITGANSLAIKFVNTSNRGLINVSAILYGDFYHNDDESMGTYKQLCKKEVPFIPKYCKKDDKMKYAIQATFPLNGELNIKKLQQEYHSLSVKIVAQDSYYGTHATVTKTFKLDNIKEDSIFELGLNTNSRKLVGPINQQG